MINAELTRLFTKQYAHEMAVLQQDLQLEHISLNIGEAKPRIAKINPSIIAITELINESESQYDISLNWDRIVDSRKDLYHGLVVFAQQLRRIWQHESGALRDGVWSGPAGVPGELSAERSSNQDMAYYAYDAVHRLFGWFSDEEIKALTSIGGCICKSCRKNCLRKLPRKVRTV